MAYSPDKLRSLSDWFAGVSTIIVILALLACLAGSQMAFDARVAVNSGVAVEDTLREASALVTGYAYGTVLLTCFVHRIWNCVLVDKMIAHGEVTNEEGETMIPENEREHLGSLNALREKRSVGLSFLFQMLFGMVLSFGIVGGTYACSDQGWIGNIVAPALFLGLAGWIHIASLQGTRCALDRAALYYNRSINKNTCTTSPIAKEQDSTKVIPDNRESAERIPQNAAGEQQPASKPEVHNDEELNEVDTSEVEGIQRGAPVKDRRAEKGSLKKLKESRRKHGSSHFEQSMKEQGILSAVSEN